LQQYGMLQPPKSQLNWAKVAASAAVLVAMSGALGYWLGADKKTPEIPADIPVETTAPQPQTVDPAVIQAVLAAIAQQEGAGRAAASSPPSVAKPQAPVQQPTKPRGEPTPTAKAAPVRDSATASKVVVPAPVVKKPAIAAPTPEAERPHQEDAVNVDLSTTGTDSVSKRTPSSSAPDALPSSRPTPSVSNFKVVGVLEGMVLVQQGRKVTPVAVGHALPDGQILRSSDPDAGRYEAGRP
jgi:hypothetical protein